MLLLFILLFSAVTARQVEVEDVTGRQLEAAETTEDTLAVYWYSKNCKTCDRVLGVLERLGADVADAGVTLLKINDKKSAKAHGVRNFPSLSLIRSGDISHYDGDMLDQEAVADFIVNTDDDDASQKFEHVTASELELLVTKNKYVAVFFYSGNKASLHLDLRTDTHALAHQLDIRLACINDLALVAEYSLGELPSLVYYRHTIPILYQGDINAEDDILEWLVLNRQSGSEEDALEEVDGAALKAIISAVENVAVLFYDSNSPRSETVLEGLNSIDDDCSTKGIHFVKIASKEANSQFKVSTLPTLVFFQDTKPRFFEGNLNEESEVLEWLMAEADNSGIDEASLSVLERIIRETRHVVVVFYDSESLEASEGLEILDDLEADLHKLGVSIIKVREEPALKLWRISRPLEVFFIKEAVPIEYTGELGSGRQLVSWVTRLVKQNQVVEVENRHLDLLLDGQLGQGHGRAPHRDVYVLYYKENESNSAKAVSTVNKLEDDIRSAGHIVVKVVYENEIKNLEKITLPAFFFFSEKEPVLYKGSFLDENEVLEWIRNEKKDEKEQIEEVSGRELKKLISQEKFVICIFYDGSNLWGESGVENLEKVSEKLVDTEIVKMTDLKEAREYGIKSFPSIIIFVNKIPEIYTGDIGDESDLLDWALVQTGAKKPVQQYTLLPSADAKQMPAPKPTDKAPKPSDKAPKPSDKATKQAPSKQEKNQPKKANEPEIEKEDIKAEEVENTTDIDDSVEEVNETIPLENEPADEPSAFNKDSDITDSIKNGNNVVTFFYDHLDKISKKIIACIERIETDFIGKEIEFLSVNINEVRGVSINSVPSLIYFKNGDPTVYEENLMNEEAIRTWIEEEFKTNQDVIEDLSGEQIHDLMEENNFVLVYLFEENNEQCDEALKQLEQIDDDTDAVGVKFVKTDDTVFRGEYGIETVPAIIYFENNQPSIYDGDAAEETELLTWLLYQMKEDTIENINRDLLNKMIDEFEFLAVFFYDEDAESVKVLRHLELIDDDASEYGVRIVKVNDPLMSKKYGHRTPPGLGFFRKGNYIKYDGDLLDEEEMLDWLTDPNIMEISDQIEKVNKKMFEKLISRNEFLTVFFYSDSDCKQCANVLQELENIDDDAEVAGIPIVKLEDKQLAKTVGVFALPSIVFFRNFGEEATIYAGDIKNEETILEWMMVQKDPSNEAIEEAEGEELRTSIQKSHAIAVFVYTREGCEECLRILTELENIDDDVARQKIDMVKTTDLEFAEEAGITKFPSLVFFKEGVPNLYEGDMAVEEEVLDWLIEMKVESHIELINRPLLETMVEESQYLAVFFYKQNCRTCDQVILELENIDDDCDMFGIQLVKIKDPQLAKRYGIKTFPALVYFRNGNPLSFEGDLKSEDSVLEWLIDDDNRELADEIEAVNHRMLDKLLESSPLIAVFFYDEECVECDIILEQLENIDDEADLYGINFVKNDDPRAARQYNIYNTPTLVYFRKMSPVIYDGDLLDDEKILEWLTSQDVFETKDAIEEVNRKMLEKILEENEFVVVYFYEDDCNECDEVLEGLEMIDDETDALDITFVKVNDPRYAKKYGVSKLPSLVYFRRKFPSIYRDSLLGETEILEWITSNRYKQLELGVFMYAIFSLAILFMGYTAFLMYGLREKEVEKKKEE